MVYFGIKLQSFGYYFTVYFQNGTQVIIFKRFCAIFYTFDVKYVTFREPVLELLSPDLVYVYMNQIETNYLVCCLYHYVKIMAAVLMHFEISANTEGSQSKV